MTALAELLRRQIRATGPITLAEYMAICLMHPEHGYYITQTPLGQGGDFTTAPEMSQMFGELIGLCLAQAWVDQGQPRFVLAELGPGRGTLMADILRAARVVPGFTAAATTVLVEASPSLRAVQQETLTGHGVTWVNHVDEIPDGPLFLVANEFFDALPIRQFRRGEAGWAEHVVALDGEVLLRGATPALRLMALEHRLEDTREGEIVETCAPGAAIAAAIGARIASAGGAALIIDYGDWGSRGDTFQAVRRHKPISPFAAPGEADLTAHVDFEALALAAAPATASGLTPQGAFLERLGIAARAEALAQNLTGPAREAHFAALRRLTLPAEMGNLFKVIGLSPPGAPPLPGLDP